MGETEDNSAELIMKVVAEMLADYALMFGDKVSVKDLRTREEKYVEASVRFSGGISGEIRIAATRPFCRMLAANILGIEPVDAEAAGNEMDALKEFANIAGGHYITSAFGREIKAYIKPPVFREITAGDWEGISLRAGGGYMVDGEPVTSCVMIDGEK